MKTITEEEIPEGFSKFNCENGKQYACRQNACPFCNHCSGVLYDYTHGPYWFVCDVDEDTEEAFRGNCKSYERIEENDQSI